VELELSIELEKKIGGGVNIWVFQVGGDIKKNVMNKIKIKMTPISIKSS